MPFGPEWYTCFILARSDGRVVGHYAHVAGAWTADSAVSSSASVAALVAATEEALLALGGQREVRVAQFQFKVGKRTNRRMYSGSSVVVLGDMTSKKTNTAW